MDKDFLNKLYLDCNLDVKNDIHIQLNRAGREMFKIITRSGIEKIQAKKGYVISHELLEFKVNAHWDACAVIKTIGYDPVNEKTIETFGECSPANSHQNYPVAIAEKRGLSRAVLKLAGLYEHGFFGEDESEDFKKIVNESRNRPESKKEFLAKSKDEDTKK